MSEEKNNPELGHRPGETCGREGCEGMIEVGHDMSYLCHADSQFGNRIIWFSRCNLCSAKTSRRIYD